MEGIGQCLAFCYTRGVVVFDDYAAWCVREEPEDVETVVHIGDIDFSRMFSGLKKLHVGGQIAALEHCLHPADGKVSVYKLVHCCRLVRVLAIAESQHLAADVPLHLLVEQGLLVAV